MDESSNWSAYCKGRENVYSCWELNLYVILNEVQGKARKYSLKFRILSMTYLCSYSKVIILQGYNSRNTTILSGVYNLSNTCFDRCCCGHLQVGYNILSEKPLSQARKHCTTGPNTSPGLPQPTGHEPTRQVHYIFIDKQDNTVICTVLYHLHTHPPILCKNEISFPFA